MDSSPFLGLDGYTSKTFTYKSTPDGDINVDVVYPEKRDNSPATVLLHIHGGFLVNMTYHSTLSLPARLRRPRN